jgi:AraC-like DNA-binding protein
VLNRVVRRPLEILQVSTDYWPEQERLASWREFLASNMVRFDVETVPQSPFRGVLALHALPELTFIAGVEGGSRQWRSRDLLADGNDDFVLVISASGRTVVSQDRQELALGEQEATLWSAAEIGGFTRTLPDHYSALCVRRASIIALAPYADAALMRRIPRSSSTLQLLNRYLSLLQNSYVPPKPQVAPLLVRQIYELVAATIAETNKVARHDSLRRARLEAIRADILANLSRVRLSPKTIAKRHGVTARYVHILFEETGQTFCNFVEEERMRRAISLLTDPASSAVRIADVALQVGYAEHSTFHRAFRRRFGDTPGHVRKAQDR